MKAILDPQNSRSRVKVEKIQGIHDKGDVYHEEEYLLCILDMIKSPKLQIFNILPQLVNILCSESFLSLAQFTESTSKAVDDQGPRSTSSQMTHG